MYRYVLAAIFFFVSSAAQAGTVGVFSEVLGDVQFLRDDHYFEAALGVEVLAEDMIETGTDASAQLDMADGTLLRIGPGSRLSLSEYELDDNDSAVQVGLEVVSGWLRFAVSKLNDTARFHIDTPTMTIGIRGTEGVIEAGDGQDSLLLDEGVVEVISSDTTDSRPVRTRLRSGEYIGHVRGRPLLRPSVVPPMFRNSMPQVLHRRALRRAHLLPRRGLLPRQIRRMEDGDLQRYLRQHPHMRQSLQQRLRSGALDTPERRDRLEQRKRLRERETVQQRRKRLHEMQQRGR